MALIPPAAGENAGNQGPNLTDVATSPRQFGNNLVFSFGFFVVSIGVGLWYTPFMIRHLGVAVYGLVPLVSSITNYLTIITVALAGTVGRYITVDLARGDYENAQRHFNTFLFIGVVLACVLFLAAGGFSFLLPLFLKIPPGQEGPTQQIFLAVVAAFLISTVSSTFESSIWACSRFDIRTGIDITTLAIRAGGVFLFFSFWNPELWQVAVSILLASGISLACNVVASRALVPQLRISFAAFDRQKLSGLWFTSRWLFVNQVGLVLFLNLDLILANLLLGPTASGQYAPLVQWVTLLRTVAMTVNSTLGPPIVVFFARNDSESLLRLTLRAVRFLGGLVALPAGLLCGFARPMFETWLGPSFAQLAPLSWWVLIAVCIEASQAHLFAIVIAANRIRGWALATLAGGLTNIALAIFLARYMNWGLTGIAIATAVASVIRNGLISPLYLAELLDLPKMTFLREMGKVLFSCVILAVAGWFIGRSLDAGSWLRLGSAAAPLALGYAGYVYFFGLNQADREALWRIIRRVPPETA